MSNVRTIQSAKQRGNENGQGRQAVTASVILTQVVAHRLRTEEDGRLREIGTDVLHVPGTASFRAWMLHACYEHPLTSSASSRVVDEAIQILATRPNRYRVGILEADATDAQAASVLDACAQGVDDLYDRGGVLVRVMQSPSGPYISDAPLDWLRSALGASQRDARGSIAIADAMRIRAWMQRGSWPTVRPIDCIVRTPFIRRDGTLCQAAGYDAESRIVMSPSIDWGHIDDSPTLANVEASVALINDLISGFEFDGPQSRAAVWSAILCLLQPELWPIPMHVFDATSKGSGKSLLSGLCASIGVGVPVGVGGSTESEEFNKTLTSCLLRGARVKVFDNARGAGTFGTAMLASYLTSPRGGYSFRILGKTEERTVVPRTAIFVSGNNTTLDEDLGRRSILCRQQPNVVDPSARTGFKHDLIGGEHMRPDVLRELVRAALTVVLWHVKAGRPAMQLPAMGSYDAYTQCVREPLVMVGIGDSFRKIESLESKTVDPRMVAETFYSLWLGRPKRASEISGEISRAVNNSRRAKSGDDRREALLLLGAALADIRGKRSAAELTSVDVGRALTKCRDSVTESGVVRKLQSRGSLVSWCVENAPADAPIAPDEMHEVD